MASRDRIQWYWVLFGVLLALGLPGACQKDSPVSPSSSDGPRVVRLEATRVVLGPGDSTLVRATVLDGPEPGQPASGAAVTFSEMLGHQSGAYSKTTDLTDLSGVASTVYHAAAGDSGLVTLKASAGTSVRYLMLSVTRHNAAGLLLTLQTASGQTSLPADGQSQLEVTVTAVQGEARTPVASLPLVVTAGDQFLDENGNGIFDQGDVVLSAGDLNGNGTWDPQGTVPDHVTTDTQGQARLVYRAGLEVGPVFLRVTGAGSSTELRIYQHTLSLQVGVTAAARELLADGVSETPVTVSVQDWTGVAVPGVLVKLVAGEPFVDVNNDGFFTPGTDTYTDTNGNGQWDAMGTITSVVSTGQDGNATARYRAGLTTGEVTILATNSGGSSHARLQLLPVPPASRVIVSLPGGPVYADGTTSIQGQVEVRDLNGTPLAGKTLHLSAGERFEDVNLDGVFTPGTDRLLDDSDGNGTWTADGEVPATVSTGPDGIAPFEYRAGLLAHQIWIRAAVDHISEEAALTLSPLPSSQSLIVTPAFDRLTVHDGGGLDQTRITAVCQDAQGQHVPAGVPVRFTIVSGPGGGEHLLDAVEGAVVASTDEQGSATATLVAGTRPGLVQVGASSGSVLGSAGVYVEAGLAASLACSADSVSLHENNSCQVRAYVYDQAHNAVKNGTVVLFHANQGLITTAGEGGSATTQDGLALATFTAMPNETGATGTAAVVAETNGGINGGISCTTYIQMPQPPGSISRLTLVATDVEIAVKGTGGLEQTRLRAQGFDLQNRPVGPGRSVSFRIAEGPGGGERFVSAGDSATVLTDAAGVAEVVLESGTVAGTVVVTARGSSGGDSQHTAIGIAAGPPVHLSVGVENCNVFTCGVVNAKNKVVAVASDIYRNPVRDGTAIYFTTSHGMVEGDQGLGTSGTARGVAAGLWHSDGECGIITVSASTLGGTIVASSTFIGSGVPFAASFISPGADTVSVNADGSTILPLEVQVLDQNSLYVLPTDVDVTCTYGTIGSLTKTGDGCSASRATGSYGSKVLLADYSYSVPDDGVGAYDLVRAFGGFGPVGAHFVVALRTGRASASNSGFDLGTTPPGLMAIFTVTIMDAWGNPLGGHVLSVTTTGGTVTSSAVTDAQGQASGLTFVAPIAAGSVLVEIRDQDPRFGGIILRKAVTIAMP